MKSNLVKTTNIYEFEWTINKKYIDFYKIPLENILVVFDDMDTEKEK